MRTHLAFVLVAHVTVGCTAGGAAHSASDASVPGPDGATPGTDSGAHGADAPSSPLRVFVTSQGFTGNFTTLAGKSDGLEAADELCMQSARGGGLTGTFVAYLSATKGALAWERVSGAGPWVAVGTGDVVFPDRAALESESLPAYRALRTERGEPLVRPGMAPVEPKVWTGTQRVGNARAGDTCADWTLARTSSGSGLAPGMCGCLGEHCKTEDWREHAYGVYPGICFCENPEPYRDQQPRLYCFEQR